MAIRFVGDIDFSKVHCTPMEKGKVGQKLVKVYMNPLSTNTSNKICFQLAYDEDAPVETHFGLDTIKEEQADKTRRGLVMRVPSGAAVDALTALDEVLVKAGVDNSKEWFGKPLSEEQVRDKYKPIVSLSQDGVHHLMKAKVKCAAHSYPTALHKVLKDDTYTTCDEGILSNKGVRGVPVLSAVQLYFLGGGQQFGLSFQIDEFNIYHVEERSAVKANLKRPLRPAVEDDDDGDGEPFGAKAPKVTLEGAETAM